MDVLTKQQESFCENMGLAGVMIAVATLIQHMIFMIPGWITIAIIPVYVLTITGFVLLMRKSVIAQRLLLISAILVLLVEAFMILSLAFSLMVFILFLYLIVIVALLYSGEIQKQLKKKRLAEKEEQERWNGIV
jgi:predicted membrane protein